MNRETGPLLQVRLLGRFELRLDGKALSIPSRAAQSLFAYLVLSAGTAHRREKLAATFWPDADERTAGATSATRPGGSVGVKGAQEVAC